MRDLGHSDHHADAKHREAVYNRLRNELLREGSNPASFTRVKAKVMADREVQKDAVLKTMLNAFVAEREAVLKAAHPAKGQKPHLSNFAARPRRDAISNPESVRNEARYHAGLFVQQFDEHMLHFHDAEAQFVLEKLRLLAEDHPDIVTPAQLTELASTLERMKSRRDHFHQHVDEVAERAVASAKYGDHDGAARALRRLTSIHLLHPQLLPNAQFDAVRDRIIHAREEHEHQAAARKLVQREREIAADLRGLAGRVQRFHAVAQSAPHDSIEYRKAEADYRKALEEIKGHDNEWVAGVVLDLIGLLNELSDPPPEKADQQVDRFITSVRKELKRLRHEAES